MTSFRGTFPINDVIMTISSLDFRQNQPRTDEVRNIFGKGFLTFSACEKTPSKSNW